MIPRRAPLLPEIDLPVHADFHDVVRFTDRSGIVVERDIRKDETFGLGSEIVEIVFGESRQIVRDRVFHAGADRPSGPTVVDDGRADELSDFLEAEVKAYRAEQATNEPQRK